jgi:hypothetical protein
MLASRLRRPLLRIWPRILAAHFGKVSLIFPCYAGKLTLEQGYPDGAAHD